VKKIKRTQLLGSSRNNKEHKVKIIGDSHFREIAARIDQYLNTKFEVNSWVKPGATTEEITATLEKDLSCLCKKDVIVINGGANDIDSKGNRINRVLVNMLKFMQNYATTNIIIVNIPHRYDMNRKSVTNSDIHASNRKLDKIVERFRRVTIVGVDSNRKHFTRQGMHLNKKRERMDIKTDRHPNKLTNNK
jgi:lysophospholipase L1-like esterase